MALGSLKLGVTHDLSLDGLHHLICIFQNEHNKIEIELQILGEAALKNSLLKGDLDLAFAVNPTLGRGLRTLHARSLELAAFVPKDMAMRRFGKLRIFDLQGCHVALPLTETALTTRIISASERQRIWFHRSYCGPGLITHLERTSVSTIGILALPLEADMNLTVAGYDRLTLEESDIGSCNLCLLAAEQRGLSRAAHKCQELLSALFQ